jgi:uncharacterized protein
MMPIIFTPFLKNHLPFQHPDELKLLQKTLYTLIIIIFITIKNLWQQIGSLSSISKESIYPLIPVLLLSFASFTYGFKELNLKDFFVILLICIFIGFFEEVTCRGILYSSIEKIGIINPIWGSSLLFGLLHLLNLRSNDDILEVFIQVAFAIGFGLILATVRSKTGHLLPGIIVHALYDFFNKICNSAIDFLFSDILNYVAMFLIVLWGVYLADNEIKAKENKESRL